MFSKLIKTHNISGAGYKRVTDWDAVWGAVLLVGVAVVVLFVLF